MTIDFSTRIDAEFLVERLQACRQVKIRIDVCGVIFCRRHRMHAAGNAEPSLFPIEHGDTVPSLEMHDRGSLVRSLRINIDGKMLAAESSERSLLHAACDFLERIGTADGGEIFIEKLVRNRQRGFGLAGFSPFVGCRPRFFVIDDGCGHRIRRTAVARVAG